jgi:hypothetical protein
VARAWPRVRGMFHVAQQLYATSRPAAQFADSRVIGADGQQATYPYDYVNGRYFSRRRYDAGWRWWIYYPTLDNTFGKAMLDSVDVMMGEMAARGVFVDGFSWGYGGEYTYDRWDGHTAEIDPTTHTIRRRKGSVILLTQDAMIAYCRKVWDRGGTVIANNAIITRTLGRLPLIVDREISEGPGVHLAQTPITLGNPGAIALEEDVYRDVLSKLNWGNLYFYYGEPARLTWESLPKVMYPITVEAIHSGTVKGRERLVTARSGIYGWPGDRCLHLAYRCDARGHFIRAGFVTTADDTSVRTRVDLAKDESAVLVRIPIRIDTPSPINVAVEEAGEGKVRLTVNGQCPVRLIMPSGEAHRFDVKGQQVMDLLLAGSSTP